MTTQEQQPAQPAHPPASRPATLAASAEPGSATQGTPLKLCHFCGGEWPEGQGDAVQKWNWLATRASAPAASAEPVAWEYFSTIEQRWCPADPDRVEILRRTHKVRALTTVSPPAAAERTQVDDDLVSSLLQMASVAPASECEILQAAAAALASAPVAGEAQPVAWENFPAYLIDHCEGDTITEEGIQRALSNMLIDQKYAAPQASPAADERDAKDAARYRLAVRDCILILRGDAALGRSEWDQKLDALAAIAAQQGEGGGV